ncbi:hypothetical protein [Butyrivibrio sp. ob235]|uniref:hypothetical protein n=1 Tax=Butyrivibrio sp. ob235 TaxID=1761780 RepID=UPI000B8A46AF|nr:hypothetical protein [Butyrivibrio sp. ob235]
MDNNSNGQESNKYGSLLILAILLLFEVWTFRKVLFNGAMIGSDRDGLLSVLMTEHWFKVLCGKEQWNTWICMYPVTNSVAFNDMYILHAILYCPLRFLGVNKYIAMTSAQLLWHFIGTCIMYRFLNKILKYERIPSLIGATAFSFGSYYLYKLWHCQFVSLSVVPLVILSLYCFWNNMDNDRIRRKSAAIAILTEVLIFYTSPYMAEYVLVTFILFVFSMLIVRRDRKSQVIAAFKYVRNHLLEVLALILMGIISMIPLLYVYLPTRSTSVRSWEEVLSISAPWYYFFNVSSTNLLYGKVIQKIPALTDAEWPIGFPFFELILLALVFVFMFREKKSNIKGLFLTSFLIYCCATKVGNFTIWKVFYKFFPGASGMRVPCRIALIMLPFVGIMLAWLFELFFSRSKIQSNMILNTVGVIIAVFVLLENGQKDGVISAWNYPDAVAREAVLDVPPPEDCASFYCIDSMADESQSENPYFYKGFLDAWLLAEKYDVPTLNGFASFLPEGYGTVYNIYTSEYPSEIDRWVSDNSLVNVYCYDFATKEWTRKG